MTKQVKVRLLTLFALCASLFSGGRAVADPRYIQYENASSLLEHLTRHANALSLNFDVSRALGFTIGCDGANPVCDNVVVPRTPWAGPFMTQVLVPSIPNRELGIDYALGRTLDRFNKDTIFLLDQWRRKVVNPKAAVRFPDVYLSTRFTYLNAISAVYFYIGTAQRMYLLPTSPRRLTAINAQRLIQQLTILQAIALELRRLMFDIRFIECFGIPFGRWAVELSYAPLPFDFAVNTAIPFPPFPFAVPAAAPGAGFVAGGGFTVVPPQGYPLRPMPNEWRLQYDVQGWEQRWSHYTGGYGANPNFADAGPLPAAAPGGGGAGFGQAPGLGGGPQVYGPAPGVGGGLQGGYYGSGGAPGVFGGGPMSGGGFSAPQPATGGAPSLYDY
jgi:hypothetical protein